MLQWLKKLRPTAREELLGTIEETPAIEQDERMLLGNVLNLRDINANNVMIPRADILACPATIPGEELMHFMVTHQLNMVPLYAPNMDTIVGAIYSEDLLGWVAHGQNVPLKSLLREVMFISPTMRTLDLLLQMRENGMRIALVIDEYGGVDGIVTFSDLIEEIIGDIQEAQDHVPAAKIEVRPDQSIILGGRASLEDLAKHNKHFNALKTLEGIETIGGLVILIAGHVPVRGEIIKHPDGFEFEILQADPRRVHRLCIRGFKD